VVATDEGQALEMFPLVAVVVDITDCDYDTTHLQENPQRLG